MEEKREQLRKSKDQEKALEAEIEALREEAKKKEKMVRDRERTWEDQTVDAGPRGWQTDRHPGSSELN